MDNSRFVLLIHESTDGDEDEYPPDEKVSKDIDVPILEQLPTEILLSWKPLVSTLEERWKTVLLINGSHCLWSREPRQITLDEVKRITNPKLIGSGSFGYVLKIPNEVSVWWMFLFSFVQPEHVFCPTYSPMEQY